jgi:hypothetical protein
MSAKPTILMTSTEVHERLAVADRIHLSATRELGEALVAGRDASAEQAAVNAANQQVAGLMAMLPIIKQAEQAALAETKDRVAGDRRKQLEKAMKALLQQALHFSANYANAASSYRRMVQAGVDANKLLFDAPKRAAFALRLSEAGLHAAATQEINRLGQRVVGTSAPGTTPVRSNFHREPPAPLEQEIRSLTRQILASAPEPLRSPPGSGSLPPAGSLPQVPSPPPAASAEQGARP